MLIIQEIFGCFLIGIIGMVGLLIFFFPVYFLLRKRISLSRQIVYFLFVVCILVICSATFLGWIIDVLLEGKKILVVERSLNVIPFKFITETWVMGERKQITQTIANILMFMPPGFIFPVAFEKMRKFWKTTSCMICFSFLIEFIQYFVGRSADIDDLILNTLGGMLGYLVYYIFSKLFKDKKIWKWLIGTTS